MIDIAKRAGVSQTTVSFVLNNRSDAARISEDTRNRVLAAARELGYSTNHLARAMRTGNTRMIGFLGGELVNEPVGAMLTGAIEEAARAGYTVKVLRLGVPGLEWHQLIGRIAEWRLSGIIALHLPHDMLEELWHDARSGSTPLVLLDSRIPVTDLPQVVSDDEAGVEMAVEHLVSLGHRRIAFISGDSSSTLTLCREAAFRKQMLLRWLDSEVDIQRGSFSNHRPNHKVAHVLLQKPAHERVTAMMCAGDNIAMSVLQVARELNLRVPDDFSLIGFANTQESLHAAPPLTTIAQPFGEMGRRAVRHLIRLAGDPTSLDSEVPHTQSAAQNANGNRTAEAAPRYSSGDDASAERDQHSTVYLPTRLIKRASTAPPPESSSEPSIHKNQHLSSLDHQLAPVPQTAIPGKLVSDSSSSR